MSKIVLFLGSGASVVFEKPTTEVFKQKFLGHPSRNDDLEIAKEILLSYVNHKDIEFVLQCIADLRSLGPVGTHFVFFNPRNACNYNNTGLKFQSLYGQLLLVEEQIVEKLFEYYKWNPIHTELLTQVFLPLLDLFKKYGDDIRIATTNYDTVIEHFCIKSNLKCIDGFGYDESKLGYIWTPDVFGKNNNTFSNNLFLYKLHGSLTWRKHNEYGFVKEPWNEEKILNTTELKNLLIQPTLSPKDGYTTEPFRTIREKFQDFMQECDICLVIGFSFRDDHITELFSEHLESGKMLIVLSPTAEEDIKSNKHLAHFLNNDNSRLHLLNKKFLLKTMKENIDEIESILNSYQKLNTL